MSSDRRLFHAARRVADSWYDGEMVFASDLDRLVEETRRTPRGASDATAAEAIVKAFAEADPVAGCTTYDDGSDWCQFCDASGGYGNPIRLEDHEPTCIWRRAVEHARAAEPYTQ